MGDVGSVVLVHGNSKVVLAALAMAAATRQMVVMVTKASGDMKKKLEAEGLNCELVEDMGVGVAMHKADCVLLGAEGVVETGGVVNQLGSYTVAGTLPLGLAGVSPARGTPWLGAICTGSLGLHSSRADLLLPGAQVELALCHCEGKEGG